MRPSQASQLAPVGTADAELVRRAREREGDAHCRAVANASEYWIARFRGRWRLDIAEILRVLRPSLRAVSDRRPSLRGAKRRSNPLSPLLWLWIASLRSQ